MKLIELVNSTQVDEDGEIFIGFGSDYEMIKNALEGPEFEMPDGLIDDKEAFRKWMKECANS